MAAAFVTMTAAIAVAAVAAASAAGELLVGDRFLLRRERRIQFRHRRGPRFHARNELLHACSALRKAFRRGHVGDGFIATRFALRHHLRALRKPRFALLTDFAGERLPGAFLVRR